MSNKYEYNEDDDFWYNKELENDEEIDIIEDEEDEEDLGTIDEVVTPTEKFDINKDIPNIFDTSKVEDIKEIKEPIIENSIPLVNKEEVVNSEPNIFELNHKALDEEPENEPIEAPIAEVKNQTIDKQILTFNQMPDLKDDKEEDEEIKDVRKDFKIGIFMVIILLIFILVLPFIYNLFHQ